MRTGSRIATAGALLSLLVSLAACASSGAAPPAPGRSARGVYVRVNQAGYPAGEPGRAVALSRRRLHGSFEVLDAASGSRALRGRIGRSSGAWNRRYRYVYSLALRGLRRPGRYVVTVAGASSPAFSVGSGGALYAPLVANELFYFASRRDGPDVDGAVLGRRPSHLDDARATEYAAPRSVSALEHGQLHRVGGPEDASGGWFDAGDYLKFVETGSFADTLMLIAARDHPGNSGLASEARFELDWLGRMWHQGTRTLDYQVGLGDGDGRLLGDHDLWRLPQADDGLTARDARFIAHRPVFRAGRAGSRISPNLAGRLAAAFGLCSQVFRSSDPAYAARCLLEGETVFDLARTRRVRRLLTTAPYSYYPETVWRDDMALGGTEIYLAAAADGGQAGLPHPAAHYLRQAARFANAYMLSPQADADSLNLYDVGGLADAELASAIRQAAARHSLDVTTLRVSRGDLLGDLHDQLRLGARTARHSPFGVANPDGTPDSTAHALGYAIEARLYDAAAGRPAYAAFGARELGWALGENAWGSSFVVGAGSTYPHCLHDQIANLSASLTGGSPILRGAAVEGPADDARFSTGGLPSGFRRCPPSGRDAFRRFNGHDLRYADSVGSFESSEPTDDGGALALLLFSEEASR